MNLTYGTVCSGIEAPSSAVDPLGWRPLWFSEIEPFPKAVLAHHYPHVPDLGDMTTIPARIRAGSIPAPDVFIGGTPCQSFSVAGLRKGLADPRGQLTRTFVEILDALDDVRTQDGKPPAICLYENVPGILSDKDNAFGNFLAALVGEDEPLQPAGPRWTDAGCVLGPTRTAAWRILDAQYFGVAQRRRRVFVVVCARGAGVDPLEVLLVEEGLRRDTPPIREAGEGAASDAAGGVEARFWNGQPVAESLTCTSDDQRMPDKGRMQMVVQPSTYAKTHKPMSNEDAEGWSPQDHSPTITYWPRDRSDAGTDVAVVQPGPLDTDGHTVGVCVPGDRTHALTTVREASPSIKVGTGGAGNGGDGVIPIDLRQAARGERDTNARTTGGAPGTGVGDAGDPAYTVSARQQAVAAPVVATTMSVRRLTPVECERLQGFPDGHTAIPWKGKPPSECPDGPRYRALGNSMAVPVIRWIARKIEGAMP